MRCMIRFALALLANETTFCEDYVRSRALHIMAANAEENKQSYKSRQVEMWR